MEFEQRDMITISALRDKDSAMYKSMVNIIAGCEAADRRARQVAPKVVIPFFIDDSEVSMLEKQFEVNVKVKGGGSRVMTTPRVAAMIFLFDAALIEHAGALGRTVLHIDGDVVTTALTQIEGRLVERTNATPRLVTGYFHEDDQLRRLRTAREGSLHSYVDVMAHEQAEGGGEHFWPVVRGNGPRVNSIVVNHFKTPAGPKQLAWLAAARGAIVFGVIFFQPEMLYKLKGRLECFPGEFHVDLEGDVITLVPESDPTQSLSHPYSDFLAIINNNTVVVDGKEYLCEKYKRLANAGAIYYTLSPVEHAFEAPEVLRTSIFDTNSARVTSVKFPCVKYSTQGVPVGVARKEVRMLSTRLELALSRLATHSTELVTPVDAFIALSDYNNTVLTSLDTVRLSERMSVEDEEGVAIALALHVNWMRHTAKGTFKTLLNAIKLRHDLSGSSLLKFATVALAAWWGRGSVDSNRLVEVPNPPAVVDWCGNDFSVVIADVDPWIEIVQEAGVCKPTVAKFHPWLPGVPEPVAAGMGGENWFQSLLSRARIALGESVDNSAAPVSAGGDGVVASTDDVYVQLVEDVDEEIVRPVHGYTAVKQSLIKKMVGEQNAVRHFLSPGFIHSRLAIERGGLPPCPVPEVDPVAALQEDVLMANGGPFVRDKYKTGYRIAEVDVAKVTEANMAINDAKRVIPKPRWVRLPLVDMGVEGKRISSQAAMLGAVFKRNVGIPSNRGTVNLDRIPTIAVEKIIQVCFVDGWEQILQRELESGLWDPDITDIEEYVGDLDETKVKVVLQQFFMEGHVDLTRWMLMMKDKIKNSRDANSDYKIDHAQTIMFLENKAVNGLYSTMMRRFKNVLRMLFRPEVCFNSDMTSEEMEVWYNSLESHRLSRARTYSYTADIATYDRSQDHVGLSIDLAFYKRLGLDHTRYKIWEQAHGPKKASAMMFGVVITMVLGGISGDWKTLMRNGIINLAAILVSADIRRDNLTMINIKGDDVDLEVFEPLLVETAVESLSLTFNLSAKFHTTNVRYFCKDIWIKMFGRWYKMADPWPRAQSACTPLWLTNHDDSLDERWESLRADLRNYDNGFLVDAVAEAAQQYYGLERPLYGMARSLAAFAKDKKKFVNFFSAPQYVD